MRIACVNQDPGVAPGRSKGAAAHLAAMRAAFRALGHEVAALDEPEEAALARALEIEQARAPIELVYERYALASIAASRFCRARAVPHVLEANAPLADEARAFRGRALAPSEEALDAEPFRNAALVLAVSSAVARYALARGAAADRLIVRPNACDPELFRPRASGDALRARLVPAGRLALGFHGRLRPWHAFELVARAAELALGRGVDLHLVLAGEGPFTEALAGRVPEERVTRLPWQAPTEVARVVSAFDALPIGSAEPGASAGPAYYFSPLKLAEAMAAGAVPIVPRLGDLESIVAHEQNGLCYAPGDARALAAAIERLAREPGLRQRLGARARADVEPRSWKALAAEIVERVAAEVRP